MDQELLDKELGSEGKLDLDLKEGNIELSVSYDGKGLDGAVSVKVDTDYFMDLLKEKIPGDIDNAIIDIIKAALKA